MNAKAWLRIILGGVATVFPLALCFWATNLSAMGTPTTPFQDPLGTTPVELNKSVTLPGDDQPALCQPLADFSTPLTLLEAVDQALCGNAHIKGAWAEIKGQAAALGLSRAAYLPTLSASVSHRQDRTSYPHSAVKPQTVTSTPINGALSWRLFDFGARSANHQASLFGLNAALASHNAMLQKILTEVVQKYFDAQVALAVVNAKMLNEDLAKSTLAAAKRREEKGAGSNSDTLQATTALARASLERNRALGSYRKELSVLLYAMGVRPNTRVTLASDLEKPPSQAAQELQVWMDEAKKQHPAILAARAHFQASQEKVAATRREGLPTLDFTAHYYENGRLDQSATATDTRESVLGLTLTIPLFDGFSQTYKVRAAEAQMEQKQADLEDTEQQIAMEMVKAHADAVASLDNLDASARLLQAAQDAQQAAKRKYDEGAMDIIELLNTQSSLAEARQERIRSLAEWRSAELRMLASAGTMNRRTLQ